MDNLMIVFSLALFVFTLIMLRRRNKKNPELSKKQYEFTSMLFKWIPIIGPLAIWLTGKIVGIDKETVNRVSMDSVETSNNVMDGYIDYKNRQYEIEEERERQFKLEQEKAAIEEDKEIRRRMRQSGYNGTMQQTRSGMYKLDDGNFYTKEQLKEMLDK